MEVKAKLNRLRMSPRKVRLVIDVIRGQDIEQAKQQLLFLSKEAAKPVLKLLNSAVANAENNFKLDKNNLFIKKIIANEGPTLKRYQPRAYGRATEIRKRSSRLEIILAEKKVTKQKGKTAPRKKEELKLVKAEEIKKEAVDLKKKFIPPAKEEKKPLSPIQRIKDKLIRRSGEK